MSLRSIIHLSAPAASCLPFFQHLGMKSAAEFVALVQECVGDSHRVTADESLLDASENEHAGGRRDDAARAHDLTSALGDEMVEAIVTIRGGAWLTRVLPLIDFEVLCHRTRPVTVWGFSELTTVVNIAASYEQARAVYDMGPAFLTYGLRRHMLLTGDAERPTGSALDAWVDARLGPELKAYFQEVVRMLAGEPAPAPIVAHLSQGDLPGRFEASFSGGNLTVLTTLMGSAYRARAVPEGSWLLLEDLNEKPERIDRLLAAVTLSGVWSSCAGLLLGDFHRGRHDLLEAVKALLPYHLPRGRELPILTTRQVGHVWPMSPLRLHEPLPVQQQDDGSYRIG